MPVVRLRLVTPPLGPAARQGRFGVGEPCPGHEGLRGQEMGEWAGRTLDEVAAGDPQAVGQWLTDLSYAPPGGGESVAALIARTGAHLTGLGPGTHRAVVEQAVVRAAVVHALDLPGAAFWRLDVRPDTVTTLTGRSGRWNLLVGQPDPDPDTDTDTDTDTHPDPDRPPETNPGANPGTYPRPAAR